MGPRSWVLSTVHTHSVLHLLSDSSAFYRVALTTSINLFRKHFTETPQKYIFKVILNPVEWTVRMNHHERPQQDGKAGAK